MLGVVVALGVMLVRVMGLGVMVVRVRVVVGVALMLG